MANERARTLRRNQTAAERTLWRALRGKRLDGHRFRRQHPMGRYVVDFICLEKKLIVEVDGGQHGEDKQQHHDRERDAWLEAAGYRVVRYWNTDVLNNLEGVTLEIAEYLRDPAYGAPPP